MFEQALNTSVYMTINFVLFWLCAFWYGATIVLMQLSYLCREKLKWMSAIIKEGNLLAQLCDTLKNMSECIRGGGEGWVVGEG